MKRYRTAATLLAVFMMILPVLSSCARDKAAPEKLIEPAAAEEIPAAGADGIADGIDNIGEMNEVLSVEKQGPADPAPETEIETEQSVSDQNDSGESDSSGMGGDEIYSWMYALRFGIESRFKSLVSPEIAANWNNQFSHVNPEGTRDPYTEHNIYNFIHELDIPREKFEEANLRYASEDDPPMYTEEEIDLLYSEDPSGAYAYFANPWGVQVGKVVYTPEWLETHTAQEYRDAGITHKAISEKLPAITELFGEKLQAERIVQNISEKAQELCALEKAPDAEITPVVPPAAEVK